MNTEVDIHDARRLRKIIQQLQNLGWSKVENVDHDFQKLMLIYRDENTEKVIYSGTSSSELAQIFI